MHYFAVEYKNVEQPMENCDELVPPFMCMGHWCRGNKPSLDRTGRIRTAWFQCLQPQRIVL
jgi:hypothetical protein